MAAQVPYEPVTSGGIARWRYTQSFFSIHEGTSEPFVYDGGVHCPGTMVPAPLQ